jgi:hypothetical protein
MNGPEKSDSPIVAVKPANEAARSVLAEAIADRNERTRDAQRAREAVERANGLVQQAETRDAVAKATLAAWRSDLVARALAATASTGAPPPISAREARADAADAQDALDAAKSPWPRAWRPRATVRKICAGRRIASREQRRTFLPERLGAL